MINKDIIVGCMSGYMPEAIKPWVNSIQRCGFEGDKYVISFGLPDETIQYLKDGGFEIHHFKQGNRHIVVERFYALYELLKEFESKSIKYRYIITTDVKDVIFQRNPSEWLSKFLTTHDCLVSSECLTYENEDWGNNNLMVSYPHLYESNKNNIIYNAGTIAGEVSYMKDFFLHIFHLSLMGQDMQPDQAAMNILIHMKPFKQNTLFAWQKDGWCCQLGTTLDPKIRDKYSGRLWEPPPYYSDNGIVFNPNNNQPFHLVHQYDRVPELKEKIIEKYL